MEMSMKYLRHVGWFAGLVGLVAVFFYRSIFSGLLPVPTDTLVGLYHPWRDMYAQEYPRGIPFKNFLITDPVRQQIPWRKEVVESLKRGEFPRYNPYTFAGVPLDANIQAAPFYPLNVLFLLFPFFVAWTLLIVTQPLFASVFMYLYLRHLRLSKPAAGAGAVVWAFGGFAIAWLTWGTILHAALWLPLMLLSIDTVRETKGTTRFRWGVVLMSAVALTVFAGHIQVAAYTIGLTLCYALWRTRKEIRRMEVLRAVAVWFGVALVVTGIQWVPLLRFVLESGRIGQSQSVMREGWFLPWQHLSQFIAPDFFGNPATLNYWGTWNYGEMIGYIGILPLLAALSAVILPGIPRFFVYVLAGSLLFMLPDGISSIPFVLHLPIVSVLQPTRLMVLVSFSLAVLTGFGFDRWRTDKRISWVPFCVVAVALIVLWAGSYMIPRFFAEAEIAAHFAVAGRNLIVPSVLFGISSLWMILYARFRSQTIRGVLTLVGMLLIVADVFRFGWKFTPFTPQSYFFPETKIISYLKMQPKPFRVMSLDDRILPPNVSGYFGIETIEGYDPIAPRAYESVLSVTDGLTPDGGVREYNRIYTMHNIDSSVLPLWNVRYVLALSDYDRPFLRLIMKEGETRLYEYTNALPRVYLAQDIRVVKRPADALAIPSSLIAPGIWSGYVNILSLPLPSTATVDTLSYSPGRMELRVVSDNLRLLVFSERYDTRWKAYVSDKKYQVFPVNYYFSGVIVPAGTHNVILTYQ